jgi:hypothetical protein
MRRNRSYSFLISQNFKGEGHFSCNVQQAFLWLLAAGVSQSPNVLSIIPQNHVSAILFLLPRNLSQYLAKLVLGEMICCSFHVSVPSFNLNLCLASSVPRPPIYLPQPQPKCQRRTVDLCSGRRLKIKVTTRQKVKRDKNVLSNSHRPLTQSQLHRRRCGRRKVTESLDGPSKQGSSHRTSTENLISSNFRSESQIIS